MWAASSPPPPPPPSCYIHQAPGLAPFPPLPFGKESCSSEWKFLRSVEAGTMAAGRGFLLVFFMAAAVAGFAAASPFLSDSVFQGSTGSTGRSLLQAKKDCPMNFEFQNYTIITNQCKGPKYPAKECCGAFKEFACPFLTYINDESNDCTNTMFSYINLYGKYPPGLFAHECREGKQGLACEGVPQTQVAGGGQRIPSSSLALITLMCALVALLFH